MTAALQERAALPAAQRKVAELEAALAAERAKIPPLEATARGCNAILSTARETHARMGAAGRCDVFDAQVGFAVAAMHSHERLPEVATAYAAQSKELAALRAEHSRFEPIMAMVSAAVGRADSYEEIERVVREGLEARSEREANRLRMDEIEKENGVRELNARIAKANAEHRLTPFAENNIRHQFAAGKLTLEQVDFMCDTMPPIAALERREPSAPDVVDAHLKHNGKSWNELKPAERAELNRADPELYRAMRSAAGIGG
jgi:hypothetical protein